MDPTELLDLLPHQGPALWLEQLLEHNPRSMRGIANGSCLDRLGPDASPTLLFEAAAQLCAAHGAIYGRQADGQCAQGDASDGCSCAPTEPGASSPTPIAAPPAVIREGREIRPLVLVGKVNAVRVHGAPVAVRGELAVSVTQQAASVAGAQYTFAIHHQERLVLDGSLLLVRADA